MTASLHNLVASTTAYRATVDRLFSEPMSDPEAARKYFFELLISVTQLYLAYLLVARDRDEIDSASAAGTHRTERIRSDIQREMSLRKRLEERLEALPCWSYFDPGDDFAEETGLRTLKDYVDSFSLHLPEIYEETLRVEYYARSLLEGDNGSVLVDLIVGLEHLGRHHISFVHFALERAAFWIHWREPDETEEEAWTRLLSAVVHRVGDKVHQARHGLDWADHQFWELDELEFDAYLKSESVPLNAHQRQLGEALRAKMNEYRRSHSLLNDELMFNDPQWDEIRQAAQAFFEVLPRRSQARPGG